VGICKSFGEWGVLHVTDASRRKTKGNKAREIEGAKNPEGKTKNQPAEEKGRVKRFFGCDRAQQRKKTESARRVTEKGLQKKRG